ncbi:MAG: hypothetical protein KC931_23625, partial [Candidatus Omnitrophica bacterium]|nr:hypothetical protein [Candidatus Omnitrophota bacterium]
MKKTFSHSRFRRRLLSFVTFGALSSATVSQVWSQDDKITASIREHEIIMLTLGRGYRTNGKYCSRQEFTRPIFAIPEDAADQKQAYTFGPLTGLEYVQEGGSSAQEFSKELGASAGVSYNGGTFSGEITANYSYDSTSKEEASFVIIQLALDYFSAELKKGLPVIPEVQKDIDSMGAETLFYTYGTHFAQKLYYGGNLTFRS